MDGVGCGEHGKNGNWHPVVGEAWQLIRFKQDGTRAILQYRFSRQINSLVKTVPGWRFDGVTKSWSIPVREVDRFVSMCTAHGIEMDVDSLERLERCTLAPVELQELLLAGRAVVYDIETWEPPTLSGHALFFERHAIIAASAAYRLTTGEWTVEQWFADTPDEEYQVLLGALELLSSAAAILTYNGDSFDVPCTLRRLDHWDLDYHFPLDRHHDLIAHAFHLKDRGQIPNAKLQTLERAYGINRVDELSGAQIPGLYVEYLETGDPSIPRLILQHNREDVLYLARDIAPRLLVEVR